MASKVKTVGLAGRQRCSSMLCLRGSTGPPLAAGATPAVSRKRRSLGDLMRRLPEMDAVREEGDPSISFPWNFQHAVHVDESLNGLPPSWAAQLSVNEKGDAIPLSPASLRHEKKPSFSAAPKSRPLKDVDANADAVTGMFCFALKRASTQNKATIVDVPSEGAEGDPGISTPWGFKHNIHVDENFSGLPSNWSKPGEAQRIDTLLDMSPEADASISVPWNFKHHLHVFTGSDGTLTGLPAAYLSRLGELGFSEGEIAAIRAAS